MTIEPLVGRSYSDVLGFEVSIDFHTFAVVRDEEGRWGDIEVTEVCDQGQSPSGNPFINTAKELIWPNRLLMSFAVFFVAHDVAAVFGVYREFLWKMLFCFIVVRVYIHFVAVAIDWNWLSSVYRLHSVEHKVIRAYELGVEATPEALERVDWFSPRCGTNI